MHFMTRPLRRVIRSAREYGPCAEREPSQWRPVLQSSLGSASRVPKRRGTWED